MFEVTKALHYFNYCGVTDSHQCYTGSLRSLLYVSGMKLL